MRDFGTNSPGGYNIAEGTAGSHVAERRSGHAKEAMHKMIRHLISMGMEAYKIADYFNYKGGDYARFLKEIRLATQSVTFEEAQNKLLGERMLSLIQQGYLSPVDLI